MEEDLFMTDSIRTVSGMYVNVFNPDPETLCIEDIAHALSHQCRFGGHLPEFYSVAQHCIYCCEEAPPHLKVEALLHDASEAYLVDIPRPIKKKLPDYKKLEENLMRVISRKYNFTFPMSIEVKKIDDKALQMEWNKYMLGDQYDWLFDSSPEEVKDSFLDCWISINDNN